MFEKVDCIKKAVILKHLNLHEKLKLKNPELEAKLLEQLDTSISKEFSKLTAENKLKILDLYNNYEFNKVLATFWFDELFKTKNPVILTK